MYKPLSSKYLLRIGVWNPEHLLRRPYKKGVQTPPEEVFGGFSKTRENEFVKTDCVIRYNWIIWPRIPANTFKYPNTICRCQCHGLFDTNSSRCKYTLPNASSMFTFIYHVKKQLIHTNTTYPHIDATIPNLEIPAFLTASPLFRPSGPTKNTWPNPRRPDDKRVVCDNDFHGT